MSNEEIETGASGATNEGDSGTAMGASTEGDSSGETAQGAVSQSAQTYTVKSGDTLSKIAKHFYGNANRYMDIFNANTDKLSDPNKIQVGQELNIP